MILKGLDLSHPSKYKIFSFVVTHVKWILVIGNGTRGVKFTGSVRHTWILPIIRTRRGTANTNSILVIRTHVVKHDIYIYPGKIVRRLL
jgi:hypothetical protein